MLFFRVRATKGIARRIEARSVVWTLIHNGKLANQIERLAAIVVKKDFCRSNVSMLCYQCYVIKQMVTATDSVH